MMSKAEEKLRFHHVGIVVKSEVIKSLLNSFFGYLRDYTYYVRSQRVDLTFIPLGEAYLELVSPHGNRTIEKYLERQGEGIHHFCFEVSDLDFWANKCYKEGYEVVSKDDRCFFIHPKSFGGILLEFLHLKKDDPLAEVSILDQLNSS